MIFLGSAGNDFASAETLDVSGGRLEEDEGSAGLLSLFPELLFDRH